MPITTTCATCSRKLRVPDNLLGKKVKCPSCGQVFVAEDESAAPPPNTPRMELDEEPAPRKKSPPAEEEEPAPSSSRASSRRKAPPPEPEEREDEEPDTDDEEEDKVSSGRSSGKSLRNRLDELEDEVRPSRRKRRRDEDEDEEDEDDRGRRSSRRRRRSSRDEDYDPHRGGLILALGISSVCCAVLGICIYCGGGVILGPLALGLGIPAWIMGQGDRRKMQDGEMDPEGQGMTTAGWICGIIGACLGGVALVCGVLALILGFANAILGGGRY